MSYDVRLSHTDRFGQDFVVDGELRFVIKFNHVAQEFFAAFG
ncbi:MAG: hypothetical protein HSCHL_0841 [Hydrogenibacillus schlegelii]|uniref:Uncharacterized protein n=1 Tax=Hydrogenibacillus schlegelii TaxID=1484 RepID=A0A2T5GCS2_HYDSH|nr:MAG: hypothetical protein HSCHL_0841 [Hydrogenibacillus schlegelii]